MIYLFILFSKGPYLFETMSALPLELNMMNKLFINFYLFILVVHPYPFYHLVAGSTKIVLHNLLFTFIFYFNFLFFKKFSIKYLHLLKHSNNFLLFGLSTKWALNLLGLKKRAPTWIKIQSTTLFVILLLIIVYI